MRIAIRLARLARELPLLVAAGFVLAACGSAGHQGPVTSGGSGGPAPRPIYKVGAPYQIKGIWYYPRVDYNYDETGVASWYGEAFDRLPTANGEIFDLNQLTAAHRTLPLPSVVEVTNLSTNRALRLRVNDRGPFAGGRIIDVSRRAARLLGFENGGTSTVRVRLLQAESIQAARQQIRVSGQDPRVLTLPGVSDRVVREAPRPPRAPLPVASRSRIFVHAGAFTRPENAQRASRAIAPLGQVEVVTTSVGGSPVYRVEVGPVATGEEAERLLARIVGSGYAGARIVVN